MAVRAEIIFIDESDFLTKGKWYFLRDYSGEWETIYFESNGSLGKIPDSIVELRNGRFFIDQVMSLYASRYFKSLLRTMAATVIMSGKPHNWRATGEEKSLQEKNQKGNESLVTNKGSALFLQRIKLPIRTIRRRRKPLETQSNWRDGGESSSTTWYNEVRKKQSLLRRKNSMIFAWS